MSKEAGAAKSLNISEIQQLDIAAIKNLANDLGIKKFYSSRKHSLIKLLIEKNPSKCIFEGCFSSIDRRRGILISRYCNTYLDVNIDFNLIKKYGIKDGNIIKGTVISNDHVLELSEIHTINGAPPENLKMVPEFKDLVPIYPSDRFFLDGSIEMRMMDLLTPIGKGQRGLIVAPPRTGKTVLLQQLANSLIKNSPESHLIILLIDERPEEVTDMARNVNAEVVASTFDKSAKNHVNLAEMVINKAKRMVEYGKDVIILLDSITRLGRAYNTETPHSGKILSGGVDAKALQGPKNFFGAARNIENGGSLTIIATALIDTNSVMDKVIFEEFKGTGNMELHLDRALADRRVWPAFEVKRSGTRKEELLCDSEEIELTWQLRKILNDMAGIESIEYLKKALMQFNSNGEFLMSLKQARPID